MCKTIIFRIYPSKVSHDGGQVISLMVITRMSSSRQNWQAEIMSYLKNLSFQECHSCWNARFKQHIGLAGVGVMSQRG